MSRARITIDLWLDGYNTDEEMFEACIEFVRDQLDGTASSVTIVDKKLISEECDE
jgi:hypothetical protein